MTGIAVLDKLSENVEMRLAGDCGKFGKPYLDEMCVLGLQFCALILE
jgi:hypothetical protein